MNSSGIKRGLAVSAISALAITGVPAVAFANPVTAQVADNAVQLYSQFSDVATVKNDGQNQTVRLEAGGGANVTSVKFQYSLDGTNFVDIATVATRNDDGAFATEWAAGNIAGATNVTIRVVGTLANGTTVNNDETGVAIQSGAGGADAVNLNDGSRVGVFQAPYADTNADGNFVAISGTTSPTTGNVNVSRLAGDGSVQDTTPFPVIVPNGATTGTTFKGIFDITAGAAAPAYTFAGDGSADQVVMAAEKGSDDVEAYTLYKQTITTVTATAASTQVGGSGTTNVTVKVVDQEGAPIAGAEVRSSRGGLVRTTDVDGNAVFPQDAGTTYYYANATDSDPFEAGLGDKRSDDVTVTQYSPAPTSLSAESADGAAFDDDEYTFGDITVQVEDQAGNDFPTAAPRTVNYYWVVTPFDGSPATVRVPTTGSSTAPTDANGEADIVFPAGEESGTYELFAGLNADLLGNGAIAPSRVLTVKAGQAAITYDEASPESAPAGTSEEVAGQLVLEDGTGLAGRRIDLTWQQGTAGSDATKDTNLVQADGTVGANRQVTTNAAGEFTATVRDQVETPQGTELGGNLDAASAATPGIGDAGAVQNNQVVDFFSTQGPAGTTVVIAAENDVVRPGEANAGSLTVTSPDADADGVREPVAGIAVTLTVDEGFFTDGTADPAPTAGADAGELRSLGKSITVVTNGSGVANFQTAIERSEQFDNDGLAEAIVTATASGASDTEDVDYTSENPLNGGTVDISFAPAAGQESGVLPKAPTSDRVNFNVTVTDQFGNKVGDEDVDILENGVVVDTITSDYAVDTDYTASATEAGDVEVTARWTADTLRYTDAAGTTSGAEDEVLTDSETVEFYEVDYANSTFTISNTGGATQPVGSTVTVTYSAVDQNGEEISDLFVRFFRNGPDDQQDGDGNANGFLGQDGRISYTYQGTEAGTARVTAIGVENATGGNTGDPVEGSERTSTVTFGAAGGGDDDGPRRSPQGFLNGYNNGGRDDNMKVNARGYAAGARVNLFRKTPRGLVFVRGSVLNEKGDHLFANIFDRNGRGFTNYVAFIKGTNDTTQQRTNFKRVR